MSPDHPRPPESARAFRVLAFLRRHGGRTLILLWIPCTLIPISLLMAGHLLTLPKPSVDARLEATLRSAAASHPGSWSVLHVLAEDCQCSQGVLRHLLARGSDPSWSEKVLFVGADGSRRAEVVARGFAFESITPEDLTARYGVEGAPLMLVMDPHGKVAYSGGYSSTSQGRAEDVAIVRALMRGDAVKELPLFGCAVSQELQKRLDPLGLKYPATRGAPR